MNLTARRWRQRSERYRGASPQRFVCRCFSALLELYCPPILEAVAVQMNRKVLGEPPVENAVAEILQRIQPSPSGGREIPQIRAVELSFERVFSNREVRRDVRASRP